MISVNSFHFNCWVLGYMFHIFVISCVITKESPPTSKKLSVDLILLDCNISSHISIIFNNVFLFTSS